MPSIRFLAGVERALKVATHCKARQDTDCSSERYGNQKPDKAEQITEGEQCENQPDRMQPDTLSHKFGRQDISFNKLADQKYPEDHQDRSVVWPELRDRNSQRQSHRIERAEDQAHGSLTAQKAGNRRVYLARQAANGVALVHRNPTVDG